MFTIKNFKQLAKLASTIFFLHAVYSAVENNGNDDKIMITVKPFDSELDPITLQVNKDIKYNEIIKQVKKRLNIKESEKYYFFHLGKEVDSEAKFAQIRSALGNSTLHFIKRRELLNDAKQQEELPKPIKNEIVPNAQLLFQDNSNNEDSDNEDSDNDPIFSNDKTSEQEANHNPENHLSLLVTLEGTALENQENKILSVENLSKKDLSLENIKSIIVKNISKMHGKIKADYEENVANSNFILMYEYLQELIEESKITDQFLQNKVNNDEITFLQFSLFLKTKQNEPQDTKSEKSDDDSDSNEEPKSNKQKTKVNDHKPRLTNKQLFGIITVVVITLLSAVGFIYYQIIPKRGEKAEE